MCGDVQLKYTILRFIPKSHDYAKEDKSNAKDVNRVAPNSDIIDIHYGHTSNTNGIIKENKEQAAKVKYLFTYNCTIEIKINKLFSDWLHKIRVC